MEFVCKRRGAGKQLMTVDGGQPIFEDDNHIHNRARQITMGNECPLRPGIAPQTGRARHN